MFSNGNSFSWSQAVIATGSSPIGESPLFRLVTGHGQGWQS